jgi:hypothetical protein
MFTQVSDDVRSLRKREAGDVRGQLLWQVVASSRQNSPQIVLSASSLNFQCLLFSLTSSSSCLRPLPRLQIISILPSNFPSVTCFRSQFPRNRSPIQLASIRFVVPRILLSSLTLFNTSSCFTRSVQPIFSVLLQLHILTLSRHYSTFRCRGRLYSTDC